MNDNKNELMFDIMNHKGELIVVEDLETLLGMINRHMGHILKVKIHTTEVNKMTELEKVKSDAFEAISKYPHLEEAINDGYGLVIDAINDGCSEEKAINDFYNWITEVTL